MQPHRPDAPAVGSHYSGGRTALDLAAFAQPFGVCAVFSYGASLVNSGGGAFAARGSVIRATRPIRLRSLLGGSEDSVGATVGECGRYRNSYADDGRRRLARQWHGGARIFAARTTWRSASPTNLRRGQGRPSSALRWFRPALGLWHPGGQLSQRAWRAAAERKQADPRHRPRAHLRNERDPCAGRHGACRCGRWCV